MNSMNMKQNRTQHHPKHLLGVFAHPEDESFCAGGTFASSVAHGAEVMVVSATRGEAGQIRSAGTTTRQTLARVREQDHVVFGGGQQHLDGKIFRVGHLGFFEEVDLVEAMDTMELRLQAFGFTAEMRGR